MVALYFAFLFSLAKSGEDDEQSSAKSEIGKSTNAATTTAISEKSIEDCNKPSSITLPTIATSLSVASALVTGGSYVTKLILPPSTSSLPMISALTVLAATMSPKFFATLSETGTAIGVMFVQMFFACSGAAGSIRTVFEKAPSLFAFSACQIGIHFTALVAIGRGIFRLPSKELYLGKNQTIHYSLCTATKATR